MLSSAKLFLSSQLRRARKLLQKLNCSTIFSTQTQTPSFPSTPLSAQLKQVFKVIDTNGDGKLSPSELKQVLVSLQGKNHIHGDKAEEEAKGIVREMDFDGDGFVDLDEFLKTVMTTKDEDESKIIMEAFRVFDENDDGLISAKELQRVLGRINYNNGTKKKKKYSVGECRRMIRGVDRDGDGFVNFDEFKFMMMSTVGS